MAGSLLFLPGFLPFRTSEELIAKFAMIGLVSLFFLKNVWLKLFMLWCIARVMMGMNPQAVVVLQTLFVYIVAFQSISERMDKGKVSILLDVICIVAIAQSLMMLLQFMGVWWIIRPIALDKTKSLQFFEESRFALSVVLNPKDYWSGITGFTSNANMGGALLGMCFPAFFRKKWLAWIPIIAMGLLMSKTLGGIFPAIISAVVFLIYRSKNRFRASFFTFCILLAGLIIFYLNSNNFRTILDVKGSLGARIEVWKFCVSRLIPLKFWTGWGLGQGQYLWQIIMKETSDKNTAWLHPHNEFIHLFLELGFIGFSIVMAYFITGIKRMFFHLNNEKVLVLLGVFCGLANCLVNFTVHVTVGIIFVVYLSMMEFENKKERHDVA